MNFNQYENKRIWLVYGSDKSPRNLQGQRIDGSNGTYWTLSEALAAVSANKDLRGVGISFKDSGLRGIDLDSCKDGDTVAPWAQQVIDEIGGYADVSMSKKGIKLIVEDSTDLGQAYIKSTSWDGEQIEGLHEEKNPEIMVTQKGFYALTGEIYGDHDDIRAKGGSIAKVLARAGKSVNLVATQAVDRGGSSAKEVIDVAVATAVNTCQPLDGENDGSNRLVAVIKTLFNYNVSDSAMIYAVRKYATVHTFRKEWKDSEILARLQSVKDRGVNVRGQSVLHEGGATSLEDRLEFIEDIEGPDEPDWILHGLIGRGVFSMINGQPKAGKSTWMTCLLDHADGGEFCNRDVRPFKALVLSEEPSIVWTPRKRNAPRRRILVSTCHDSAESVADWNSQLEEIEAIIVSRKLDLVVLDTVAHLSPCDENDAQEVTKVCSAIKKLAQRANVAILAVHHTAKNGGKGARGSGVWTSSPDININFTIKGDDESRERKMRCKGRFEQVPEWMNLSYRKGSGYTVTSESEQDKAEVGIEEVQEILMANQEGLSAPKIMELMEDPPQKKSTRMKEWLMSYAQEGGWHKSQNPAGKGDIFHL